MYVVLRHAGATSLARVGLQVWSGALLLCDWLLELKRLPSPAPRLLLELGCGVGLVGIAAAKLFEQARVVCTDHNAAVLARCRANAALNSCDGSVACHRLDWRATADLSDAQLACQATLAAALRLDTALDGWLRECGRRALLLISEGVYDTQLTSHLVRTLLALMLAYDVPRCVLTLERRTCFALDSLSVVCAEYEHFVACVGELHGRRQNMRSFSVRRVPPEALPPQSCHYERQATLELWEITCRADDASLPE